MSNKKGSNNMIEAGMSVKILSGTKYKGAFIGKVGLAEQVLQAKNVVGVQFEGKTNPASGTGLFWFTLDQVEVLPSVGTPVEKAKEMPTRPRYSFPGVNRVIYSGPKTIILWTDGTKTIVSCGADETYDHYTGFCAAVVKKLYGSTSHAKKVLGTTIKIM